MHSAIHFRSLKPRRLPAGFPLFLAKVSGLALLWLALWAALAASAAIESPQLQSQSHLSPRHQYQGER